VKMTKAAAAAAVRFHAYSALRSRTQHRIPRHHAVAGVLCNGPRLDLDYAAVRHCRHSNSGSSSSSGTVIRLFEEASRLWIVADDQESRSSPACAQGAHCAVEHSTGHRTLHCAY
jgi:hypothetical protein